MGVKFKCYMVCLQLENTPYSENRGGGEGGWEKMKITDFLNSVIKEAIS